MRQFAPRATVVGGGFRPPATRRRRLCPDTTALLSMLRCDAERDQEETVFRDAPAPGTRLSARWLRPAPGVPRIMPAAPLESARTSGSGAGRKLPTLPV